MIVFIGIAGSGKSAQARALHTRLGIEVISVGDILRKELKGELRDLMLAGEVMPNDVTIPLIEARIAAFADQKHFVLEGFARSKEQAEWVVDWARRTGVKTYVFHLHASTDVVMQRLLARGRADDNDEAIRRRFKVMYTDIIDDIVKIMKQDPILYADINAELSLEQVTEQIISYIHE